LAYSLFDGLVQSKNEVTLNAFIRASGVQEWEDTMFAQRNLEQGLFDLTNTFESFGLYRNLDTFCYPVILGGNGVRVADMAAAYSTIARGGGHVEPFTATRLKLSRNDRTLDNPLALLNQDRDPVTDAIIQDPVNLFRLTQMLQGVISRGTARSISEWSSIIAGKTGTVEVCGSRGCKNTDTWFVGFNKEITVAVWVGYPNNRNLGDRQQGSNVSLPIFKDFMEQFYSAYPEKESDELIESIPSNLVSVYVEGTTGYLIDDDFRNAFAFYTGRAFNYLDRLGSVIYVTEDERRQMSRYRYTREAMSFFFDHLTDERRAEVRANMERRQGGFGQSAYDIYQYNLSLCEPYLVSNGRGGRTWNPRAVPRTVDQACRYVASTPAPEQPEETRVTTSQLREYFINNY
jgi:membrane carboxypeptidase/penicillin-binding protein